MAIAFGSSGAKVGSATGALDVPYPAVVAVGDLLEIHRVLWNNTATADDIAGWDEKVDGTSGTGSTAGAHTTRIRIDTKTADAADVAAANSEGEVATSAGGTISGQIGVMVRRTNATGAWDVQGSGTVAGDTSHAANRATSDSGSLDVAAGDVIVAGVAIDRENALAMSAAIININSSATGVGAKTIRFNTAGTLAGNDGNVEVVDAPYTGSSRSGGGAFAMSSGQAQCGPVGFLRLREVAASEHHEGGSTETVHVTSQGDGTKHAGDGSTISTETTTDGDGTKHTTGGSVGSVDVLTEGSGIRSSSGGSSAVTEVGPDPGTGTKHAGGGSDAGTVVQAEGTGVRSASGGSTSAVDVETDGSGTKHATGSDTTQAEATAYGTGTKHAAGGSTSATVALLEGTGTRTSTGGSTSSTTAAASGTGEKAGGGGSTSPTEVHTEGSGSPGARGGGSTTVVHVTTESGGIKVARGGSSTLLVASTHGTGTRTGRGGSTASTTAATSGAGTKRAAGGSVCTVIAYAVSPSRVGSVPAERMFVVESEQRLFPVRAETRMFPVAPEKRLT